MPASETLALVESPAQLLNAVEWLSASPDMEADVVVLAPRREESRRQLRATMQLVAGSRARVEWCEARQDVRGPGRLLAGLVPRVRRARRLVLGDPFSGLIQSLLTAFTGDVVVVVDDGSATLEFADRIAAGEAMVRWHVAEPGALQRRRAAMTTSVLTSRPLELFTAMPLDDVGLRVRRNRYRWLRTLHPAPQVVDGAVLVGSSLVETGVVARQPYLEAVARLAEEEGLRRYLAHRREDETKLGVVADLGLEVQRLSLPLEVELAAGPVERLVLSFPSTVLVTLPIVLEGTGVEVRSLPVPPGWLRPGAGNAALEFLDRVARRGH
ncbi:hypothetical protein [Auraticoccus monumenti]|uniref:Uncharacterized protein n=1 Tax=Auraticoccus monumenti TaxID=675864 RepID=A0A1G7B7H3_9ACTN|nr:hypothetical protein [Auraticoccus monumenti]SDE22790.1 hypothetical protein SAMN04489747_2862 [Auraticoccus monumenti]